MHNHKFKPSTVPHYEECAECGTLHRTDDIAPDSVYSEKYWNRPGCSTLKEQVYNLSEIKNEAGESKMDAILKHAQKGSHALEIACAPGILLTKLRAFYDHVVGIEYDSSYRQEMLDIVAGHGALMFGAFPQLTEKWPAQSYDFICGMDIAEHVEDGEAFIKECKRLMKPDATLVLMSPFIFPDGEFDEKNYHPEHVNLFSQKFLKEWLGTHFKSVDFGRWQIGHETVIAKGVKA